MSHPSSTKAAFRLSRGAWDRDRVVITSSRKPTNSLRSSSFREKMFMSVKSSRLQLCLHWHFNFYIYVIKSTYVWSTFFFKVFYCYQTNRSCLLLAHRAESEPKTHHSLHSTLFGKCSIILPSLKIKTKICGSLTCFLDWIFPRDNKQWPQSVMWFTLFCDI